MTTINPSPGAVLETITPERAAALLENNPTNRKVRQTRVNLYADAMRSGQWLITGETIKIGNGKLIDGQHRLWACIEAGVSFNSYVVYGVPDDAMTYIDSGLTRTMADVVDLSGLNYTMHRSAIARLLIGWEANVLKNTNKMSLAATRDKILKKVTENPDATAEAIRAATRIHANAGGNITPIAAFIYRANTMNPEKAAEFIEKWHSGEMLSGDDPIRALRVWITSRLMRNTYTDNNLYLVAIVKAWNAYISGTPLKKMIVKEDVVPEMLAVPVTTVDATAVSEVSAQA